MKPLKNWLKRGPLFEFLQRIRYRISPFPRRSKNSYITNTKVFPIQDNVVLETSYLGPEYGPGPVASVYIYDQEVMRLDCLGGDAGHYHVNLTQSLFYPRGQTARLYFPNGSVEQHIEMAAFQLRRNLDYARRQNYRQRIRAVKLDQDKLDQVANEMTNELLRLYRETTATS